MRSLNMLWLTAAACTALLAFSGVNRKSKRSYAAVTLRNPYIVIDKSDYELKVFDEDGWYATYPVVFGNKSLADKKMEGDRLTPEGNFSIISKRPHEKWGWMLMLNYPTKESWERFKQRKSRGEIPSAAKIGGGIGIHGTWPHEDFAVDNYNNWTNGCISLKREDTEELYRILPVGTRVTIQY